MSVRGSLGPLQRGFAGSSNDKCLANQQKVQGTYQETNRPFSWQKESLLSEPQMAAVKKRLKTHSWTKNLQFRELQALSIREEAQPLAVRHVGDCAFQKKEAHHRGKVLFLSLPMRFLLIVVEHGTASRWWELLGKVGTHWLFLFAFCSLKKKTGY